MNYTDTSSDDFEASCTRVNPRLQIYINDIDIYVTALMQRFPNIVVGLRDVIASKNTSTR
jgi:hypothetical protein